MEQEQLIAEFKLPTLDSLSMVNAIVALGYLKTGRKFTVSFNGSKGYLSNIVIFSECQPEHQDNIIWVEKLTTQKGTLKSLLVTIFHSSEKGVTVVIGNKSKSKKRTQA